MSRKSILNQLELAYAPLTAFEFAVLKDDPMIERALWKASLSLSRRVSLNSRSCRQGALRRV